MIYTAEHIRNMMRVERLALTVRLSQTFPFRFIKRGTDASK